MLRSAIWSTRGADFVQPPTKYVLETGRRGPDLSEGIRAHLSLEDVDALKRKHTSE
jgi:hypothetical protein